MTMTVEWPGRCGRCNEEIADWSDAGLANTRWVHKSCFSESRAEAQKRGVELEPLRSPEERSKHLELPMLIFLLMFHFGLGAAVAGWVMITQGAEHKGTLFLIGGIITPLIGLTGVAFNVLSRRRIELIRQTLDLQGGWKPGR